MERSPGNVQTCCGNLRFGYRSDRLKLLTELPPSLPIRLSRSSSASETGVVHLAKELDEGISDSVYFGQLKMEGFGTLPGVSSRRERQRDGRYTPHGRECSLVEGKEPKAGNPCGPGSGETLTECASGLNQQESVRVLAMRLPQGSHLDSCENKDIHCDSCSATCPWNS